MHLLNGKICRLTVLVLVVTGCSIKRESPHEKPGQYEKELEAWHAERITKLTSNDGWLNLLGLYWLQPGINTFGTDASNQIVFPDSTVENQAGYFVLFDDHVEMHLNNAARYSINGKAVAETAVLFNADSTQQPQVENGSIAWTIIRRDGRFGIRVRDLTMKALKDFRGIKRFAVDPDYRIDARFAEQPGRTIDITNVLGQTTAQASPGTLIFKWEGNEYKLDVLDGGKDEYFVIIGDQTSGLETYGGGRYLYVKHADANGMIVLDFNKAHNPPCVFTPYATCPLPPKQNLLPFSILAGEKI